MIHLREKAELMTTTKITLAWKKAELKMKKASWLTVNYFREGWINRK
ncbi:MAG: hypothetical protein AB9903_08255 [Vulcanimicrobiota bacterium]